MEKYQEYLKENIRQNLRACQLRQLEILKEIDRICQKYDMDKVIASAFACVKKEFGHA